MSGAAFAQDTAAEGEDAGVGDLARTEAQRRMDRGQVALVDMRQDHVLLVADPQVAVAVFLRQIGQQALAVLEERAAFVGERDAARGAHHQLDAQAFLERVDAPPDHRRRHALGLGSRREAALASDADEGLDLLEFVHGLNFAPASSIHVNPSA